MPPFSAAILLLAVVVLDTLPRIATEEVRED